jgi:hypothetical protein
VTARRCTGTTRVGEQCRAAPLRDGDRCLAHADEQTRTSMDFGQGPRPGRPRVPRSTDLQRELVERHAVAVVRPYFRALGLDVADDGTVTPLERGAIVVGRDKEGGVHASSVEDLGAQIAAAEALLNRVYGRPRQALEHTGKAGGPIEVARGVDLRKLTDGELDQLEELLTRASPEP